MGGCAGKLKDSDIHQEPLPVEGFASHKKAAEGEIVAQDGNNGGEIQTKMAITVIDPCGSEGACDRMRAPQVHALPVSAEASEEPAKKTEDKVDAPPVSESKDKVEAGNEIHEPAKEGQAEAKADKPDAAPSSDSEDKSGALLATA